MKSRSHCAGYRKKKFPLEIIETEIADSHSKPKLPRHISQMESTSHRGGANLGKIDYIPRICQIDPYRAKIVNLAVDILKYQLGDRQVKQKHLANVRCDLERRLQVAKARGNQQLINILNEEFKQLEASI